MARAQSRKLKSGAPAHAFTPEERAKGGRARAAKLRKQREAARDAADAQLIELLQRALQRLDELLDLDDPHVVTRAVREVLDRVLGKPTVRVEHAGEDGGPLRINLALLSDDELELLHGLIEKTQGGTDGDET